MTAEVSAEARRQQQMLAALVGVGMGMGMGMGERSAADTDVLPQDWPRVLRHGAAGRGLAAYRSNARAHAARALAAGFPTVAALVGDEALPALAAAYLQARPPVRGDLAWLGAQLPDFIASSAPLASEPYLADVARLDAAVAQAQVATDAVPELATLQLLGTHDPDRVWLRFAPGTQLVCSRHPIASIWWAHQAAPQVATDTAPAPSAEAHASADANPPDRFVAVRAAFAHGHGERALVWRHGWHVSVQALAPAAARATAALLAAEPLGRTLDAAGPSFDFGAWLAEALRVGLVLGASDGPAAGTPSHGVAHAA